MDINNTGISREVTLISAPFSGGQGKAGCDEAPKMLEEFGLSEELEKLGWKTQWDHLEFEEVSEDPVVNNMKRPRYVAQSCKTVYDAVNKASSAGQLPLTVGGDHSIAIGTVAGVLSAHSDACVLWIDAHADLNTPAATLSGNLHGCPVSFLFGIDEQDKSDNDMFSWVPRRILDPKQIAYIGLRDVDEFEKKTIKRLGIAAYSMHDIDRHGIATVMSMALEKVNPGLKRPIHLSFDVDALDPFFAPSTGTPVRGGLTWREGCFICEAVSETGKLVGMDLVECNPHLGGAEVNVTTTLQSGIALVKSALGHSLL